MRRNVQSSVIDFSAARASHPFRPQERSASPCSIRPFSRRPRRGRPGWLARALGLIRVMLGGHRPPPRASR